MKSMSYGAGYKYSHDYPGHFVEQQYLPDPIREKVYYHPSNEGAERSIGERLATWWKGKKR